MSDPYSPYSPYGPATAEEFRQPPSMLPAAQSFARVIELPWPIVRTQQTSLAVLYARGDRITSTIALWSSPDGETYQQQYIGTAKFAALGVLAAGYDANASLIDERVGMVVDFGNGDRIETVTETEAASNTWLAFVGDEILSVRDVTIVSSDRVKLLGQRRGLYGTPRQTHAVGAKVLFIRRDQLRPFIDAQRYRYGTTWHWKIQPVWFNRARPIEDCEPLPDASQIESVTCRPAPHCNLRVNGRSRNPVVTWGEDIAIAWDLADWRSEAFWPMFSAPFIAREVGSKIEVYDADNALVRRQVLGVGVSAWTYDSASQAADFGATPASFKVRLNSLWDGYASKAFEEVEVRT